MARISLDIYRAPHQPSLEIGYRLPAVRLLTDISLMGPHGWGPFHPAVIDTGAPLSMFPRHVWKDAEFSAIGRVQAGGIVQREECKIPATLARVKCLLTDGVGSIGPLEIHAYLAESSQAPTLLGMAGVLEETALFASLKAGEAFLELA